ncbi:SIR2 family protein [Sphingobacterium psychroaquaticum]|uniref:Uncharacterized protein n=1 Tax=Sphingobacterium psychroaquaticum TaxID=561061 RepID=A0A1X7IEU4_9SPHI|nr:hypothetical protein [Sphingobacterium psychroaquaticum]SMG13000.1 hypothetical protein SAMN05660862_0737 [Sphingobacterium psychroaquaticum]
MNKTVYVLGAGFSMDAGAPSQANLVKAIYDLKGNKKYSSKRLSFINKWIEEFDNFLKNGLCVSDEERFYYTLEDVYTPIDKCISENASFRGHTIKYLQELRDNLNRLITLAIRESIDKSSNSKKPIDDFANFIVNTSRGRLENEKEDKISIITTNWDIMLDNKIYELLFSEAKKAKKDFIGVVDYCCYLSSLDEHDNSVKPGLYALGKGGYNVKILKLHGSLNWMQCPKCQRLYVKFYRRFNGGYVFNKKYCRHCERNFKQNKDISNKLEMNLIMPTFLKNLNNIQNKLIWQNAGIELSEADKIVFIGYSLPQADFEFKQLLSRMIKNEAKIEVYLIENDNPEKYKGNLKYLTAGYRYQNFFSKRELKIEYSGVKGFVKNNCR